MLLGEGKAEILNTAAPRLLIPGRNNYPREKRGLLGRENKC